MRNIKIMRVMNGFVVGCGCQELVFETSEKLIAELKRYLDSPDATEKEYTAQYGLANGGCDVAVGVPATTSYPTPPPPTGYLGEANCSSGGSSSAMGSYGG